MTRATTVNDSLREALATYENIEIFEGRLLPEICAALGMAKTGSLGDRDYPVAGFFIDASKEDVLSIYLITPGRFILYEVNDAATSFTMVLPIERVRHIERLVSPVRDTLTVEFDAHRTTARTTFDEDSTAATAVTTFAKYELTASTKTTSLDAFAIALSNTLGL